jgi:hypothetical protein
LCPGWVLVDRPQEQRVSPFRAGGSSAPRFQELVSVYRETPISTGPVSGVQTKVMTNRKMRPAPRAHLGSRPETVGPRGRENGSSQTEGSMSPGGLTPRVGSISARSASEGCRNSLRQIRKPSLALRLGIPGLVVKDRPDCQADERRFGTIPGEPSPAPAHRLAQNEARPADPLVTQVQAGISDEPGRDSGRPGVEWRGSAYPCRVPP